MKACVAVVTLFALVAVTLGAEPQAKEGLQGSEAVYLASPYTGYAGYPGYTGYAGYGAPLAYSAGYRVPAAVPGVYSGYVPAVSYLRR